MIKQLFNLGWLIAAGLFLSGLGPFAGARAATQTTICDQAGHCVSVNGGALTVTGTFSASLNGFTPNGSFATLNAGTSSTNVGLPAGTAVLVQNTGTVTVSINLGTSNSVTAATTNLQVPPGGGCAVTVGANTYLAGITGSGSATLILAGGSGLANTCYGGGSAAAATTAAGGGYGSNPFLFQGAQVNFATSTSTAVSPTFAQETTLAICNASNSFAFVNLGTTNAVTATTGSPYVFGPNSCQQITQGSGNVYAAAILLSGTGTLYITPGITAADTGLPASTNIIGYTTADPCSQQAKLYADFSSATSGGSIITAVSGKKAYACHVSIISAAAQNVSLIEGTGSSVCTGGTTAGDYLNTGTTAANGAAFAANGGISAGNGSGTVFANATANQNTCVLFDGAAKVNVHLSYVLQ